MINNIHVIGTLASDAIDLLSRVEDGPLHWTARWKSFCFLGGSDSSSSALMRIDQTLLCGKDPLCMLWQCVLNNYLLCFHITKKTSIKQSVKGFVQQQFTSPSCISPPEMIRIPSDLLVRKSEILTLNSDFLSRHDRENPPMSELKFHPFFWLVVVRSHPPTISPSLTSAWLRWYTSGAFWAIPSPRKNQFINWGSIIGRFTTFLNPWSDQLKRAFQLSITATVHMETPCPDSRRGPSGTVSWSGLFRTVSRQDKMCQNPTCKLHGAFESMRRVFGDMCRCSHRWSHTALTFAA